MQRVSNTITNTKRRVDAQCGFLLHLADAFSRTGNDRVAKELEQATEVFIDCFDNIEKSFNTSIRDHVQADMKAMAETIRAAVLPGEY